jgi:MFS family permease
VRAFRLACLAYLGTALPASPLGLLWPAMRISFHQPVGALGVPLAIGIAATVVTSPLAGRLLARAGAGTVLSGGVLLLAAALAEEAGASSLWAFCVGTAIFGVGFGAIDTALNAHAAGHFGPRQVNWMHASYGLGATIGPALVTVLLAHGTGWREIYGVMAAGDAALAVVLAAGRHAFPAATATPPARPPSSRPEPPRPPRPARPPRGARPARPPRPPRPPCPPCSARPARPARPPRPKTGLTLTALAFVAVETGIESGVGLWGYVFLTAGRGLPHQVAGLAVAGYGATMLAGRVLLGPVAERAGTARVLGGAVAGVAAGAAVMALPGPVAAVAGMMLLGLAAAPVFPLFTLTTADRVTGGAAGTTRAVSLQVAASALGSAALPAGLGLVIGAAGAQALAPVLLGLGLAMCGIYALLGRPGKSS